MEYNILLIKPDKCRQQMFSALIQKDIVDNGFRIISVTSKKLSREEFEWNFISKNSEHVQYMTESNVIAILYGGYSAVKFARIYKGNMRKSYTNTKLKNILHSTEPGNEYSLQFKLFFGDHLDGEFLQYSDQGTYFSATLRADLQHSSMIHQNIVCEPEKLNEMLDEYENSREVECFGVLTHREISFEIVEYFSRFSVRTYPNCKKVAVLLIKDVSSYKRLISKAVERHSIEAVVTYRPGLSLLETENLRTEAFAHNLFCVGGSFGLDNVGSICCSKEMGEALELRV